jgi:predicted dehydrogenase
MTVVSPTYAILGCGSRGGGFSTILERIPELGTVVAVAEPDRQRREAVAARHHIPADRQFERWEDLLAQPRLAEAIINTLMDRLHAPSTVPALEKGYHMLLEKPMATTLADCIAIDAAQRRTGRVVSVCHNLRYNSVYREIHRLLTSGTIGRVVGIDQMEAVQNIHMSHSFVRGNWANEARSSFMLLSKSCHDLDIIFHLVGKPCLRVSSFGRRTHFREENAPAGAPMRCTDGCPAEPRCPYSTYKVYLNSSEWIAGKTYEEKLAMMRSGPYGRCVYRCDNDVVDHQVVNLEFADGVIATFTMTAFTTFGGRTIRVHGTDGYLRSEINTGMIEVFQFADNRKSTVRVHEPEDGHYSCDVSTLRDLSRAILAGDPDAVLTTTCESLASHAIVFAAERSRREGRLVEVSELQPAIGTVG